MARTMSPSSWASSYVKEPTPRAGSKGSLLVLSRTSSSARHQPDAARLADQGMGAKTAQPLLEVRSDGAHMVENGALLIDLQRLQRDRGGHRMAGIGEAVGEQPSLSLFGDQRFENRALMMVAEIGWYPEDSAWPR